MNGDELCANVSALHASISGAVLVEGGLLRAIHFKPQSAVPKQERLESMIAHTQQVSNIFRMNEDQFGKFHYLTIHFNNSDVFVFPIAINARKFLLAVTAVQPYLHEELTGAIRQYLGEMKIGR